MTANQGDLFDEANARAARDDGMQRVWDGTDEEWTTAAVDLVRLTAIALAVFSTDHVIGLNPDFPASPGDPRVWGPVITAALKAGWITPGTYGPSTWVPSHYRQKMRWVSLIQGKVDTPPAPPAKPKRPRKPRAGYAAAVPCEEASP